MVNNTEGRAYDIYVGIMPKSSMANIESSRITCPLGQLVIASYAKERIPGLDAIVYDCSKCSEDYIVGTVRDDAIRERKKVLVGITLIQGNEESAFDLARRLDSHGTNIAMVFDKEGIDVGIDVVVGGPVVAHHGLMVKENRPYIKLAVAGAGEKAITRTLREGISQSMNFGDGLLDFKGIKVDYDLLDSLDKYQGLSYLWGNDCQNAEKRCYFCGRHSLGKGFRDPAVVWQELLGLYRKGFRNFYNTTDSVAVDPEEFRRFVEAKPKEMTDDTHKVFINASQVTTEMLPLLKRLNSLAHIGIENPALFAAVGKKGASIQDNDYSLGLLEEAGISSVLSFVVGIPGENEMTLQQNKEYIEATIRNHKNISWLMISPLMVTPGSQAYADLMQAPEIREKYKPLPLPFDSLEMSEDYFRQKTSITRQMALEWIKEIRQAHPEMTIDTKGITCDEADFLRG